MLEGRRVLVVEAARDVARRMTDGVEGAGGTAVGPAASASEALGMIGAQPIDAALVAGSAAYEAVVLEALVERGVHCLIYEADAASPDRLLRQLAELLPARARP